MKPKYGFWVFQEQFIKMRLKKIFLRDPPQMALWQILYFVPVLHKHPDLFLRISRIVSKCPCICSDLKGWFLRGNFRRDGSKWVHCTRGAQNHLCLSRTHFNNVVNGAE